MKITVKELKEKIADLDDSTQVQVGIRTYTQAHTVAWLDVFDVDARDNGCTVWVSFPEGSYVVNRKKS
jgi:hypothetical protein